MSGGRIYLDVDGVFNAVSRSRPQWGWKNAPKRVSVKGWPITYSPEFVAVINDASKTPGVDVFWLTTWCHDAVEHLAPALGIDGSEWPVVGYDHWRADDARSWWKLDAIREHLGDYDGPVLWIDDDLHYSLAAVEWLKANDHVLGICPRAEVGVTKRQGDIIQRFVTEVVAA